MFSVLSNSALTFEIYFSSGAAILFLVACTLYHIVFGVVACQEGEEATTIVCTLACILSIIALIMIVVYTNGYLSRLG